MELPSEASTVRRFECRRLSSALGLVFILMFACRGYCDVMMTSSESILVEGRATVRLPCEFEMVNFSMFQNPIIWNKRQAITEEEIPMNIMGNILEPFLSTHRFQASLENEERRYRMTLRITDFSPEDVGNYSCEVRGRKSVVLGKVQHSVSIKAPSTEIKLEMANSSSPLVSTHLHDYPPSERGVVLLFVENQFQPVSCTCRSFGPHQEVRILLGDMDVSSSFDEIKLTSFTGVKGLHIVQYTVIRTSFNLTFTALDDDRPITCSVSSPGTPANKTERLINVIHKPYIKCPESTAYPGETNVFLRCLVRARPPLTSLYWDFHHNDTTNKGNSHTPDVDDYWSTVTDRNDGWMETKFFMRHVNNQSFKNYKVVSENQLGVSSMLVKLRQISKPLPYESRLQSDNPSWHHKPNPSLEYMVIRSAPNRPSSVPAGRSASFRVTVACVIFSISKNLRTSARIFQFLLLKFWTVTSFCFFFSSSCLLGQP